MGDTFKGFIKHQTQIRSSSMCILALYTASTLIQSTSNENIIQNCKGKKKNGHLQLLKTQTQNSAGG